jgi:anti-sigma factor RsiW
MSADDDLSCRELVELVTDYFEDALTSDERTRFERHLAECDGCVNYVHQIRTTIRLTGGLREDDLAADVEASLLAAFRGWRADSPG